MVVGRTDLSFANRAVHIGVGGQVIGRVHLGIGAQPTLDEPSLNEVRVQVTDVTRAVGLGHVFIGCPVECLVERQSATIWRMTCTNSRGSSATLLRLSSRSRETRNACNSMSICGR